MAEDGTAGDADPNSPHRPFSPPPDSGWSSPTPDGGTEPAAWSAPSGGYRPPGGHGYGPAGEYGPAGGYGQQQTTPPTGPFPTYGPYQPPRKSHTGLIVGLSVGAAVLLLAGGLAVLGVAASSGRATARAGGEVTPATAAPTPTPSPSSPVPTSPAPAPAVTLRIPGAVAGYKQMKGGIAKRSITEMRRKMGNSASAQTKIALYTKGLSHLVFVGLSGADEPEAAAELADSPSAAVDSVFSGSGVNDPKDFPTGSVGGVLRCGKVRQQGITVAICAWADSSALLALHADRVTPKRLSTILLSFHGASVRGVIAGA
ncbi:hypothetical protein ACRYCC_14765 [Actinomadura scrupuli]|uniref:hypothetical protein n=1 Tax=Actinomadura scrupuli TaxID=559629 RepID=UPI003D97AB96